MQSRQGYRFTALRGVDAFLDDNGDVLPSVSPDGIRRRLKEQIATLEVTAAAQAGSTLVALGETRKQRELHRVLLQEHLAPIVRIARAERSKVPELDSISRLPRSTVPHAILIAAAEGIAMAAGEHREVFIEAGLPETFVDNLRAAAARLEGAIDQRTAAYGARSGATVGIATQLSTASHIVNVIDALVKTDLKDDPERLARWMTVKAPTEKPGPRRGMGADRDGEGVLL